MLFVNGEDLPELQLVHAARTAFGVTEVACSQCPTRKTAVTLGPGFYMESS